MGTPDVPDRQNEEAGPYVDRILGPVPLQRLGKFDFITTLLGRQASYHSSWQQVDAFAGEQFLEGEIGRVFGTGGANQAGVAASADVAAAIGNRVPSDRVSPPGDPRLLPPLPQQLLVVGEWDRRHRVGLGTDVERGRARFSRHPDTLLRFLVELVRRGGAEKSWNSAGLRTLPTCRRWHPNRQAT